MSVIGEIEAERRRQIEVEGYTAERDGLLRSEDLMEAALAYFWHATGEAVYGRGLPFDPPDRRIPRNWPWDAEAWKPKDRRTDLLRAGALCLAEQDRCLMDGFPEQTLPAQTMELVLAAIAAFDRGGMLDGRPQ